MGSLPQAGTQMEINVRTRNSLRYAGRGAIFFCFASSDVCAVIRVQHAYPCRGAVGSPARTWRVPGMDINTME